MKVNFLHAVIGEIDDNGKKTKRYIRDYKLRCNTSFHSIILHLKHEWNAAWRCSLSRCLLNRFIE